MSEIKTCEQYVLAELDRTKKLLDVANDTILDLQKDLDVLRGDCKYNYKEHLNTIELSKEPSYYYYGTVNIRSYSKDMIALEETVGEEKLKEALTSDEVLEEIGNTKFKSNYKWYEQAIEIDKYQYDWLFSKEVDGKPDIYVITDIINSDAICNMYNINDTEFSLDREVLYNNLKKELREEIEKYLINKDKKEGD